MAFQLASICPACGGALQSAQILGQDVGLCSECEGLAAARSSSMKLWPPEVDAQHLGQGAARRFGADRRKPARKARLNCPFCQSPMETSKFAAVEVDECSRCHSLWLDAPEVELLAKVLVPYKWKIAAARAKPGPGERIALAKAQSAVGRFSGVNTRRVPGIQTSRTAAREELETLERKMHRRGLKP